MLPATDGATTKTQNTAIRLYTWMILQLCRHICGLRTEKCLLYKTSRLSHGSQIHKMKHLDPVKRREERKKKRSNFTMAYLLPNICTIILNNTLLFPPVIVRIWSCILNRQWYPKVPQMFSLKSGREGKR